MSWALRHIEDLGRGKTVKFRARGRSMEPKIPNNSQVTIEPITEPLKVGDVVLCRVHGNEFLHFIKAMKPGKDDKPGTFQIGNNKKGINGWTPRQRIYGILTAVNQVPFGATASKPEPRQPPPPKAA